MLQVIDLEWDTRIVFIQNPAPLWIVWIVSDAHDREGIDYVSDLIDSIIFDGKTSRRSVMCLTIHLIRVVRQREGWRSVR